MHGGKVETAGGSTSYTNHRLRPPKPRRIAWAYNMHQEKRGREDDGHSERAKQQDSLDKGKREGLPCLSVHLLTGPLPLTSRTRCFWHKERMELAQKPTGGVVDRWGEGCGAGMSTPTWARGSTGETIGERPQ
eukprot:GGOE01033785.1.p3 GENE.GGOE01033785.1~~GGOE01033785.1.p3  ORF type:complete len:133 (+),score=10.16 GGOE01033785.1:201-599(+)